MTEMAILFWLLRLLLSLAVWWARGAMTKQDEAYKALQEDAVRHTPSGNCTSMTDRAIEWAVSSFQLARIKSRMDRTMARYDRWTAREAWLTKAQSGLAAVSRWTSFAYVAGVLTPLEFYAVHAHGGQAWACVVEATQKVMHVWGA